ncbi:hypothetical protein B0H67DRAFT_572382 [Lasiosphaeris hirsuta]|uniref:Stress-response A/B barrel domain-containing protein n=1 Tax=Lasiosphaeris hirsuta TaxID=260670 RepID=A0AA40B1W3_9PEZI|nr:hypothetical protein B0H67DRAFT_572382 [Lasiosphaeris hirsuta]
MGITHTVRYKFKSNLPGGRSTLFVSRRFLGLKETCVRPTRHGWENYIRSLTGGKDSSPEGLQKGMTHGFVVEFDSVEDRNYYVTQDPTYSAFVKSIENLVEKTIIVDFTDGEC